MNGINQVTLIGRLGQDPKLERMKNGKSWCRASLAISRPVSLGGDKSEYQTEWFNVTAFAGPAEVLAEAGKGAVVFIFGRLQMSQYTDKQGNERKSLDVIVNNCQVLTKLKKERQQQQDDEPDRHLEDGDIPF